jgi:hypothetical protein
MIALCLLAATPAYAQGHYSIDPDAASPAADDADDNASAEERAPPPSHTIVVTSIEKCYAEIGHAEAMDIEQHYTAPYEECQRRLALKVRQQQTAKPGQQHSATVTPQSAVITPTAPPPAPMPQNPPPQNSIVPGPPDNPGTAVPGTPNAPIAAPLSDEGLYYRVQKNALPQSPPVDNTSGQ